MANSVISYDWKRPRWAWALTSLSTFLAPSRRLINILLNNCEFVNERLSREKRYLDATRDPTLPNGLELKRRFVAPLAKRVRNQSGRWPA